MTKNVELFRKEFSLEEPTHIPLNNAGMCLVPKVTARKLEEITQLYAREGNYCAPIIFEQLDRARASLARLVGAEASEISWTPNCSAGISFIANGFEKTEGEEIVIFENDYPANFYPWCARARENKSELKIIQAESDLCRIVEKVVKAITPKTRIVAFSHIQSDCGYLMDISPVAEAAHRVGAIVVVDVIQSAGICPIDFKTMGADVLSGGTHKWLCSPAGAGFLAIKENVLKKISPTLHGALNYGMWDESPAVGKQPFENCRKFEQGTPSFHSILGAMTSVEMIQEYAVDNLWKKAQGLRQKLKNELADAGFQILGGARTGPHISITHSKKDIREVSRALDQQRISHALRPVPLATGKVLRLSPHAYNTEQEISHTIDVIKKAIG